MKKYKWRLYAEKNIEPEIVGALRKAGIDVLFVTEDQKLSKEQDDEFHYQKAGELGRYLLTKDEDFWSDVRFPLHKSPGVIILRSRDPKLASLLVQILRKLIQEKSPFEEPIYLEGIKIRLSDEGVNLRYVNYKKQKKTTEFFTWTDLFP